MSVITPTPPVSTPTAPPTLERPRGAWLALRIGAVITGLLVILAAVSLFQLMGGRSSTTTSYSFAAPSTTLAIEAGSADVTVLAASGDALLVDRTVRSTRGLTSATPSLSTGQLALPGGCDGSGVGWLFFCSVHYVIQVPVGTTLRVHVDSGDIDVAQLDAPRLVVEAGSGDVSLRSISSPDLTASTGSGDIGIDSLTAATSRVHAGSGDVRIDFAAAPTSVRADTGSGDLRIRVPRDSTPYVVVAKTGSGDYSNQVDTTSSGSRTISAQTGSGDLSVGYSG
jgi:hypothetical protein